MLLATLAVVYSREVSHGGVRTGLIADGELAGSLLQAELMKYARSVEQLGADADLKAYLLEEHPDEEQVTNLNQKLYLIMAGRTEQLRMYVADADGHFCLSTGSIPQEYQIRGNWGIFRRMAETPGCVFHGSTYTWGGRGSERGLTLGARIEQAGEIIGYVLLDIPQDAIGDMLTATTSRVAARYTVLDAFGFIVYNEGLPGQNAFLDGTYHSALNQALGDTVTCEIDGERTMISAYRMPNGGLVAANVSTELMMRASERLNLFISILAVVFALFLAVRSKNMAENIVKPIETICAAMGVMEQGNWDMQIQLDTKDEFAQMAGSINHMVAELNEQFRTNLERQDRLRLAEFKNLQAQISPHFLSNTLESIKWLARLQMYEEIQIIVEKLGILLKSGMVLKKDMITLGEELNVVDSYLTIQKIRYEDKFTARMEVLPEFLSCQVPNLVIQPIVENAIVHSVEKKRGHITIQILARRRGDDLEITIRDDGAGIPAEQLERLLLEDTGHHQDRESIGLVNVHKRLKLYFGEPYGLRVESREGEGTAVTLTMPFQ